MRKDITVDDVDPKRTMDEEYVDSNLAIWNGIRKAAEITGSDHYAGYQAIEIAVSYFVDKENMDRNDLVDMLDQMLQQKGVKTPGG